MYFVDISRIASVDFYGSSSGFKFRSCDDARSGSINKLQFNIIERYRVLG